MDGGLVDGLVSPLKKLVRFFRRSRDLWKGKHQSVKAQLKLCRNQVRAVEKSRERWREQAEAAQRELRELRGEMDKKRG